MKKNNAQNRPHCVDLKPGAFTRTGNGKAMKRARFLARSAERHHRQQSQWSISQSKSRPYSGAVRLTTTDQQLDLHRWGKVAAACMFLTSGALWLIPGTSGTTEGQLNAQKVEPEVVYASFKPVIRPQFVFDDNVNALATQKGYKNNDALANTLTGETSLAITVGKDVHAIFDPDANSGINELSSKFASPDRKITQDETPGTAPAEDTMLIPTSAAVPIQHQNPSDEIINTHTVQQGDSTWDILIKHGVPSDAMAELMTNDIVKKHLNTVKIGQQFEITQLAGGEFVQLETKPDNANRILIKKSGEQFTVEAVHLPVEKERFVTAGTIEQSLYLAAQQANLSQSTIMALSSIFQWELDFARDIRKGDQFSLVYDKLYRDGNYIGDGDILAAEFIRGGKTYRAIRFTTDDGDSGYFTPEGQSLRRAFMRHPVDVVRITSHFDPNRMHPVLHQIRAHRGVDYGSPHGSAIYATADGKVKFSGKKGAYGKTVILQHGQEFSTLYAHMSKISDKSKVGRTVKQGDVIGYVGATGRVTGTHLHYEFRVNNKHVDPLKVELPAADPLPKRYLSELRQLSESMSRQMAAALAAEKSLVSR